MPIVKNKQGLEKIFIENLEELGDLSARTNITDSSSNVFLKASAQGVLEVNDVSASTIKANDGNDGAGTDRTIKCDGNGILFCKEIGTVNIAPANSANGELTPTQSFNVKNDKITQGYDTTIASGGNGLQQVLMYGRENGGDLRALECNGDRLIVDCIELSPTGPHTPTSLPSVAIHGQVGSTSGFKNLRVTTDGRLETKLVNTEYNVEQYASQSLAGNSAWGTTISTVGYSNTTIAVNSNATTGLFLYGSETSGGTYIPFKSIMITSEDTGSGTHNVGYVELVSPPPFIKIYNVDAGGVTLEILVTSKN